MIQSIPLRGREQVAYRQDELRNIFMGLGIVLFGLSVFFDQPGLAALLTIAFLLRVVKHRA
jgi:hypothetical protein